MDINDYIITKGRLVVKKPCHIDAHYVNDQGVLTKLYLKKGDLTLLSEPTEKRLEFMCYNCYWVYKEGVSLFLNKFCYTKKEYYESRNKKLGRLLGL